MLDFIIIWKVAVHAFFSAVRSRVVEIFVMRFMKVAFRAKFYRFGIFIEPAGREQYIAAGGGCCKSAGAGEYYDFFICFQK